MISRTISHYRILETLGRGERHVSRPSGYTHARLGERRQALQALEQLSAASKQNYPPAFAFAWIYTGLGDHQQAFEWLEKTREVRFTRLAYLRPETFWEPLRSDPRFTDLLHRIGFPQ